jgi:hypothetical protein
MFDILYTGVVTVIIMMLLHHLYNYLQSNLTVPKVQEIIQPSILNDLHEIQNKDKEKDKEKQETNKEKDELKEYMNQFKKK